MVGTLRHVCVACRLPRLVELRASLRDFLEGRLARWGVPPLPGRARAAVALLPAERLRWPRLATRGWWVPVAHDAEHGEFMEIQKGTAR